MAKETIKNEYKVLRLPDVLKVTGLGRSTIYALVADGAFPRPIKLSVRASGWSEAEVRKWLQSRLSQRDKVGGKVHE